MNLIISDQGTAFTLEQTLALGRMLDIDELNAQRIAGILTGFLAVLQSVDDQRRAISDIREEKDKFRRVQRAATALAEELEALNSPTLLVGDNEIDIIKGKAGEIDYETSLASAEMRTHDLKQQLERIAIRAEALLDDDADFRSAHFLVPVGHAGKLPVAVILWPQLFRFWEDTGHRVATTPNGPLHRFVSFIHDCAGIAAPVARTLRDAVERWEEGGREEVQGRYPPWRIQSDNST